MGGKRTSKEELTQIEAFSKERLTCREIAEKLGRSPAAIRNLRYKKHLVTRAEDESKALFQQRDEMNSMVKALQGQKALLASEVDGLRKEKKKLEEIINSDKILLEQALAQGLMNLKQYRPDLFTMSDQEQMVQLLGVFLKGIFK